MNNNQIVINSEESYQLRNTTLNLKVKQENPESAPKTTPEPQKPNKKKRRIYSSSSDSDTNDIIFSEPDNKKADSDYS